MFIWNFNSDKYLNIFGIQPEFSQMNTKIVYELLWWGTYREYIEFQKQKTHFQVISSE